MRFKIIILTISVLKFINCNDSESFESKHVEITPSYDTIVFGDVIDIVNELNKNNNFPFNTFADSDSESDENVEDLLTEYQHFLDKAHEQRRIYLEKANQTKNKIPLRRHDNFVKTNPSVTKYGSFYNANNFYPGIFKMPSTSFNNPLDLFIPMNPTSRYLSKPSQDIVFQRNRFDENLPIIDKYAIDEKKPFTLPYLKTNNEQVKPHCICPSAQPFCKQCLKPLNSMIVNTDNGQKPQYFDNGKFVPHSPLLMNPTISEHLLEDMDNPENTLNVKIKVDVQFPKSFNILGSLNKKENRDSAMEYDDISKEIPSSIRIPTTSFNFPIPLNMFGFKRTSKINKHESSPFRKLSLHKKKKSRSNTNINKKHRKKLITFHNLKISPSHSLKSLANENQNISISDPDAEYTNETHNVNVTENITSASVDSVNNTATSTESAIKNTTQFEEHFYLMVNITNNSENETDDMHKTGNSIEFDFKTKPNISMPTSVREKRDLGTETKNDALVTKGFIAASNNTLKKNKNKEIEKKIPTYFKKPTKSLFLDTDLLYWPNGSQNVTIAKAKNIMDIIIEREANKAKLNLSKETIRRNRTMALEQAIFGQVDWDDMDAVAPTFISFVGKYVNGILTFCSQKICHSVNCAEKRCVHRTCLPEQRFNHIGHCSGSNGTDSVASMESLTDLPSNVAFEIVDILQDKLYGKLYGKVTLCISLKCNSFAASKKFFLKSKCSAKNLNRIGHCPNTKKL